MTLENELSYLRPSNHQSINNLIPSSSSVDKNKRNVRLNLFLPEDLNLLSSQNENVCSKKIPTSVSSSSSHSKSPNRFKSGFVLSPSLLETPRICQKYCSIDQLLSTNDLIKNINNQIKSLSPAILNSFICKRYHDEEDTALMSLQFYQLGNHIKSLHIEQIQRLIRPALVKLYTNQRNNGLFNSPVDVVAFNLNDYFVKITKPMDLGTVKNRLSSGYYESLDAAIIDIKQVFINAMSYNPPNHSIHTLAAEMLSDFICEIKALEEKRLKEIDRKESHNCSLCLGSQCHLCGEKCLKFEPPALGCQSCSQKIKRNSIYFISSDGLYTWCQKCQVTLPSVLDCVPTTKKQLLKRKLDEEVAEPWVSCDKCGRWVHQICAIYSSKFCAINASITSIPRFECPTCKIESIESRKSSSTIFTKPVRIVSNDSLTPTKESKSCRDRNTWTNTRLIRKIISTDSNRSYDNLSPNTTISASSLPFFPDLMDCSSKDDFTTPYTLSRKNKSANSSESSSSLNDCDFASDSLSDDSSDCLISQTVDSIDIPCIPNSSMPLKRTYSTYLQTKTQTLPTKSIPNSCYQWKASLLPKTKLSDFLECLVSQSLQSAGYYDIIDSITIRVVSNSEHEMETPIPIVNNFAVTADGFNYFKPPSHIIYRNKCILLFQSIDGIDVCLFCLYVQEFDKNCPPPNNSVAYIAYLDSVDYFRPANVRTMVYHEVMTGYMKWIQMRGFERCHIWSCPPQRGDNFIFWCHPPHQKTPSRERLNAWYNKMLNRCKRLEIIDSISSLYETYFDDATKQDKYENNRRNAAKNSFVGSGKAGSSRHCSTAKTQNFVNNSSNSTASVQNVAPISTVENNSVSIPFVCPPVFEGDHWVQDFLRCYRNAINRMNFNSNEIKDILSNQRRARDMLKDLMSRNLAVPFNQPVDSVALNLPTYHDIITHPMDLGTVRQNLRSHLYPNFLSLAKDVRLTFHNAMKFNPCSHPIHTNAQTLLKSYNTSLKTMVSDCTLDSFENEEDPRIDDYLIQFKLQNVASNESQSTEICNVKSEEIMETEEHHFQSTCNHPESPYLSALSSISYDYSTSMDDDDSQGRVCRTDSVVSISSCLSSSENWDNHHISIGSTIPSPPLQREKTKDVKPLLPFDTPELGFKRFDSIISELKKGIHRLKDDLFVINLKSPSQILSYDSSVNQKRMRVIEDECITIVDDIIDNIISSKEVLSKHKKIGEHPAANTPKPGRPKNKNVNFNLSNSTNDLIDKVNLSDELPKECLELLSDVKHDTSDPDELQLSSFVGFRHTFLEMCQFRHYQFDSLRRAKHSSLMLLYHLHNPNDPNTRPVCSLCFDIIKTTRYHCDQCACFELCSACYVSNTNIHEHLLTPFRVTYT